MSVDSKALKKILNHSERISHEIILKVLADSGYIVLSAIPEKAVFNFNRSELNSQDWEHYKNAIFDFLILDPKSDPILAIEFDGPDHSRPGKKRSDIRKNRLCNLRELPILRINDKHIQKED